MTHAASRRACHSLPPVHHDLEAGRDLRPGRPAAHTGRLRDAGLRVLPGMIMLAGRLVDPPAARKRSARSTRPSGRTHSPPGRLVRDRPVHRRARRRPPTAACSSAPRGQSGSARTPRSSPPSRAPVRSSRPARDRHWPPPSTRADRRPVYPRTLRQHREARIMSGHSRSATAHPGYSPHRIARLGQAATTTGHHRRVISSILRSRRGPSIAEFGHEDIHPRTGPCHRLSGRLIRDEPRRCHHPVAELRTG